MGVVVSSPQEKISKAAEKLSAWIEKEAYQGWDPYDALTSPLLQKLAPNKAVAIAWVQLLKISPWNFRPILGIVKDYNPKGMGLLLGAYLRKYLHTRDSQDHEKAMYFAEWLVENHSTGFSGRCWGYPFPWPNRSFYAPAHMPTIVNTSFIAFAFLDLDIVLNSNKHNLGSQSTTINGLDVARSACEFIMHDLNPTKSVKDELCFSYTPMDQRYVHNANMLGAALLAAVGERTNEQALLDMAFAAAKYTIRRQDSNGAWKYGESTLDHWIDNFHTGFILNALKKILPLFNEGEFQVAMERGYQFWKDHFFLPSGAPRYRLDQTYPIDSHCIAQAILTFLAFRHTDPEALQMAQKIAIWGIENMQSRAGFYYYQRERLFTNRIPYMRWSQAWMLLALNALCMVISDPIAIRHGLLLDY